MIQEAKAYLSPVYSELIIVYYMILNLMLSFARTLYFCKDLIGVSCS